MRILFTADLHGQETLYAPLLNLAARIKPDAVVLGGDLLPDDSALARPEMGVGQPRFVRGPFRKFAIQLAELARGAPPLVIHGNHDWSSSAAAMRELASDGLVRVLSLNEPAPLGDLKFVGYSCTPPTPWFVKDFERLDMPGDVPPLLGGARWDARFNRPGTHGAAVLFRNAPTIADELALFRPPAGPWVFVSHAPPHDVGLDRTFSGECWGSRAVKAFIEKHQPALSLHGHVHEAPTVTGRYQAKLGKTLAVNPGQTGEGLCYALVHVDGDGAVRVERGHQA